LEEVLAGTNSQDRKAGAEILLREFVARNAIGLVTTHDLALAGAVDTLGPAAANVHFEDQLVDGKLAFDYILRPGVVTKSNELALAWFNKADFEKARIEAQHAVEAWPEHLAARKLLSDVGEIIVGGPVRIAGIGEHDLRVAMVTVEQQQLEITNHILHGGRF